MSNVSENGETSSTPLLGEHREPGAGAPPPPSPPDIAEDDVVMAAAAAAATANEELLPQAAASEAYPNNRRNSRYYYRRLASLVLSPVTDEQDSVTSVLMGLFTMALAGTVLGGIMPKNDALNPPWYRTVSSMIGYTFFTMWSISFYPQVINNFRRRTTRGLSADFCGLNCLGFAAYSAYNVAMFYSKTIHKQYQERHGADAEITVQSNDVAFAVHAFLLASITFLQIGYYDGFRSQRPSRLIERFIWILLTLAASYPLLVWMGFFGTNWLDYLYLLSFMKVAITLIKYIPQVILNYQRKSTVGFSIWQILLDFGGGVLSDVQLVCDSAALHDFTGITGNPAKFALGFTSIFFDVIFMTQHYILYRVNIPQVVVPVTADNVKRDEERTGLVAEESVV